MEKVTEAAMEYIRRRNRQTHPSGRWDRGGRWYASDSERCDCCRHIRTPSRAYPYSEMAHCRTAEHVANLYGVNPDDVRRAARAI
jgi:hypothetical protein